MGTSQSIPNGIDDSYAMAKADLGNIHVYKGVIKTVAMKKNIDPSLIAGIISRESRGQVHDKPWNTERFLMCEMQKLDGCIQEIGQKNPHWSKQSQLKGGIAAYNIGVAKVFSPNNVDEYTTGGDYSKDVMARAQWYKSHHHF